MSPVGSVKGYKYIDLGSSLLDVVVKQIQSINNDDELKDALAKIVLDNTRNFMPYDTGYLDEHTYVKDGKIIYDTPYARRLYEGILANYVVQRGNGNNTLIFQKVPCIPRILEPIQMREKGKRGRILM